MPLNAEAAAVAGAGWWYAGRDQIPAGLKPVARIMEQVKAWWAKGGVSPRPAGTGTSSPPGTAETPAATKPATPVTVTPPPLPAAPAELQDLKVEAGRTRYQVLTLPKGGRILVLRGEVANTGKALRGPVLLKAALVDARHRVLKEETAYSGTTVSDEELKTLDRGVIQGWLKSPGGRQGQSTMKPGEKQPFVVVFFDLPDNFQEAQPGFQVWPAAGPLVTSSP
uniref:Uncharacterized protein n=1 Tax=Desulfobacca acetoxidans TaxID=60893 RepID=A0A7V4G962_9BACT